MKKNFNTHNLCECVTCRESIFGTLKKCVGGGGGGSVVGSLFCNGVNNRKASPGDRLFIVVLLINWTFTLDDEAAVV